MLLRAMMVVLLAASTAAGLAEAQPQEDAALLRDLQRTQGLATSRIPEFRRQVREFLDENEKKIEASITYTVLPVAGVNAQAVTVGGSRQILVGAGLVQVLEWLSVSMLMPRLGDKGCAVAYQRHVLAGIEANGRHPKVAKVFEPFTFASRNGALCRGISFTAYGRDEGAQELTPAYIGASFRHVLAHEVAHHILGHHARNDEESRRNEEAADAFAFRVSSAEPTALLLTIPAHLLFAGLGANVEDEAKSSHPSGPRRVEALAGALKALPSQDPDFKRYLSESGLSARWSRAVEEFAQSVADALGK